MNREVTVGDHRLVEDRETDRPAVYCRRCGLGFCGPEGYADAIAASAPTIFRNLECDRGGRPDDRSEKNARVPSRFIPDEERTIGGESR